MISLREIVDTSQGDRTIIVPSPWGYCTARWPYNVRTILWGLQRHRAATLRAPYAYRKSLRSFLGQDDNLKPCVVLTITVRCPSGIVRCHCDVSTGYGLTIFSNLSLCGVKQNRRGHDARKSVRWSLGLPAEAARKRWLGHRTGIVYSTDGKCNRGITSTQQSFSYAGRFFLGLTSTKLG